jgi:hypothetical protein
MPLYRFNEGELLISEGWEDKSVNGLAFPVSDDKAGASFTITRDRKGGRDKTLSAYVDQQVIELAKTCPKFELLGREPVNCNGTPAMRIDYTWRTPDKVMVRQEQFVFKLSSGMVLSCTSTAPSEKFEHYRQRLFRPMVMSLRLGRG